MELELKEKVNHQKFQTEYNWAEMKIITKQNKYRKLFSFRDNSYLISFRSNCNLKWYTTNSEQNALPLIYPYALFKLNGTLHADYRSESMDFTSEVNYCPICCSSIAFLWTILPSRYFYRSRIAFPLNKRLWPDHQFRHKLAFW